MIKVIIMVESYSNAHFSRIFDTMLGGGIKSFSDRRCPFLSFLCDLSPFGVPYFVKHRIKVSVALIQAF